MDSEEIENRNARVMWNAAQRIAMQIADKPTAEREEAVRTAARMFSDGFAAFGAPEDVATQLGIAQGRLIWEMIARIDHSGGTRGGSA